MEDFHPTQTAGDGKPFKDIKRRKPGEDSETLFIKCPHCGMRNKRTRDSEPGTQEPGIANVAIQVSTDDGNVAFTEPQRVSGCTFCGHNYKENTYTEKFFSTINLQGR